MNKPVKCPICDAENWKSLDKHRSHRYWYNQDLRFDNPVGFKICLDCAFCTYDYVADLKEVYDSARKIINVANIITCNRKTEYHKKFLEGAFDNWGKGVVKVMVDNSFYHELSALDVGCAQGYLLNLYHVDYGFKKENLFGTEFSEMARNYTKNVYDIETAHDIPKDSKYDLISYYHVLEHIPHPDRELENIKKHLNKNGLLYISVPVWFGCLEEASGPLCNSFENLFHVNHINTWTKQGFYNLLNKAGFEIIKESDRIYGQTVLCQLGKVKPIIKESAKDIEAILLKQKVAIELLNAKEWDKCFETYPNFPDLYVLHCMNKENMKDIDLQMQVLTEGMKQTSNHLKVKEHMATIYYQWDQSSGGPPKMTNNIRTAEKMLLEILDEKPTESAWFTLGMIEGKYKKNRAKAKDYLEKVIEVHPSRYQEMQNFICNFDSLLVY